MSSNPVVLMQTPREATAVEGEPADAGIGQLLTFPPVSEPTSMVQAGLFDPAIPYPAQTVPEVISFGISAISLDMDSSFDSVRVSGESDSLLSFSDTRKRSLTSNALTNSSQFNPTLFTANSPRFDSVVSHGDLCYVAHSAVASSNTDHQSPLTNSSPSYQFESPDLPTYSATTQCPSKIPSANRWSAYSSPTSVPSSVSESPTVYTSLLPYARYRLPFPEPSIAYDVSTPSPASADLEAVYPVQCNANTDTEFFPSTHERQRTRLNRLSSADRREERKSHNVSRFSNRSSSTHIHDQSRSPEIVGWSNTPLYVAQQKDYGLRRAFSGPQETIQSSAASAGSSFLPRPRPRVHHGGRFSDSYITVAPPTHDDSGILAISKAKMWTLAQDTPTFDVDDDVFDGSEAVSPKKQVASDALVTAATGRRKNEAAFHCEFSGCEATFTAKHNLHNHLNSHFGIKSFRCPQCLRDFGTPHVLRRHQLICKGKKRFPPLRQPG
ncbi:hypothetical protein C8R41DRAFT_822966 [Lentinula lateritia]|uniref:C2H2-type domain-containing protein n=1 Tax=Lentinula lateritia TaxID=40482 RepID=A0ABQ8VLR8_9AGAR|nr:hypothetical protein C8R41DRAFT_822966 [Lentinula lateritia]